MFTLEEHVVLDGDEKTRGLMVTTGPGAYKIPGFSDIPRELNVSLLKGVPNKRAIYSSKVALLTAYSTQIKEEVCVLPQSFLPPPSLQAIGEPPLFLASSVFFAIKDAVAASRWACLAGHMMSHDIT